MIPEREPEKWLLHPRIAAGAQLIQSCKREVVRRSSGNSFLAVYCNGESVLRVLRNNWRASLVPAAAVIPASLVYINVAALKRFVVYWSSVFTYFLWK